MLVPRLQRSMIVRHFTVLTICCLTTPLASATDTTATVVGAMTSAEPARTSVCSHHVAPNGDDADAGTRQAPWSTIGHAVETAVPGDVICVSSGRYSGNITISRSGAEHAPITIVAADPDVEIAGTVNLRPGVAHLRLSGLRISGGDDLGVVLWGDNSDVLLRDLDIVGGIQMTLGDGDEPLFGPVENVRVERSTINGSRSSGIACRPGPCRNLILTELDVSGATEHGLTAAGEAITVRRSFVHDNGGDGIVLAGRTTMRVEHNHLARNRGTGIRLDNGGDVINNLVMDSGDAALRTTDGVTNIVNNTFAACHRCEHLVHVTSPRASIDNNILFNDSRTMTGALLGLARGTLDTPSAEHNLLYNRYGASDAVCELSDRSRCVDSNELEAGSWGSNRWAEPRFFAAELGDFHLLEDSPAVNSGRSEVAPPRDLDGHQRDSAADLGAFEHQPDACLLACGAHLPATIAAQTPLDLRATITTQGCSEVPRVQWTLGDGTTLTARHGRHTYDSPGQFEWAVDVAAEQHRCTAGDTIRVVASRRVNDLASDDARSSRATPRSSGAPARVASLPWWTVDGGGGTSSGGAYTLSATIGQPDASGPQAGGSYTLTGGFWAGAPRIHCDVDLNGACDAADLAWVVACADDPSGCGAPGNPDVNRDAAIDGLDLTAVLVSVY